MKMENETHFYGTLPSSRGHIHTFNTEIIDVIKVYTKYRKNKGKHSNRLGAVEKS